MRRLATTLLLGSAIAPALANDAPPGIAAAGWAHGSWNGIAAAAWHPLPGGGIGVEGQGQGSFVWRPAESPSGCLSWRWRVLEGPPAMDLTRRGTDRALSVTVGFAGFPPGATAGQRTKHALASATAPAGRALPRSALVYVWGGSGREPRFFASPYAHGLAKVVVLRAADAPRGAWLPERVDLAADWRAAFGGEPPPVTEIAISSDGDDSRSRVSAAVADLRMAACR